MENERYEDAFRHLREVCGRAVSEQEKLLKRLLRENEDTFYGKRYCFADIRHSGEYRRKVPLTEFSDYDGYIDRIINGEGNVLTSAPAVFFNISSGSVGEQKYIPIVREDIDKHRLYAEEAIPGIVQSNISHDRPDDLFGCIFNIGDVFMTSLPDGRLCGVRSGIYLQSAMAADALDASVYTAPPDIMFPKKITDMLYPKVRCALANENITAIHGVFIHRAAGLFAYIERNFDAFIYDIRHGTVGEGFRMSDDVRRQLEGRFVPDPARADRLASLAGKELGDGMLLKIWPKLRYIRCINGGQFSVYGDSAAKYVKGVPIHSYIYAASESVMGVSPGMDMPGEYVLIPDVCYTEFLPADDEGEGTDTLTIGELETGKRYEIIITTLSGLYRYRIGDVIEVTGRYGEAPVIKVCYRKGLVMNIADERMNLSQLEPAVMLFEEKTGISTLQYCFSGEMNDTAPRYVMYIEGAPADTQNAGKILDECLCKFGVNYKNERSIGSLGMPAVKALRAGSFAEYYAKYRDGKRNDQLKPLRILSSSEQTAFFNSRTEGNHE
ncbi:MAG: GH3 auxin-responsive promoter family protein [Oscillospiraceae bacterium]|nr:GH3 auxin-responsive promoter family protein [Oscillospiraceae bacterium]